MEKILKSYLRKLTNLSTKNRSIFLPKISAYRDIDLDDFDYINNQASHSIIEDIVSGKSKIHLCNEADSRDADVNVLSRQLKRIRRADKFIFDETGSKNLYVGYPFVRGKLHDDTHIRCPLIFFPVELGLIGDKYILKPRKDVSVSFNKSFLLAYGLF